MKIEIYGIPEDLFKCPGCIAAVDFCRSYGLDYTFIPVIVRDSNQIGFAYNRPAIEECRIRAGKDTSPRQYPQIFVDDKWIGSFETFKQKYGEQV
ncbi:glutaredoxin [Aeromonas phage Ah1]|uniref:Glutaredoxin n=1 Tax=Aeromonas phage Ah1 TaxID=2053701 RepID=A0A2H4YEH5_9CAUD|nr:glutaredoxin [Aeromonas phage Ah1]AUE22577.1 glutaredoxin [Aeromonas phage Ah1]UYD60038.1 hypothetical protein OPFAMLBM_00017 [Aeromonas phage avDM12-TAAL]